MKNKIVSILSIVALIAVSITAVFAWYDNNLETSANSDHSVKVASSGSLQIAFAHDSEGNLLKPENASYGNSITLDFSTNGFDDITGDGVNLYLPVFTAAGNLVLDTSWVEETLNDNDADNAAISDDKGKYAYIDLYFRSDVPMDVYLQSSSSLSPKSNTTNGSDLANSTGQSKTLFKEYPSGLPNLNINQSSYGFFSRNLIAGASRVSFSEIGIAYDAITHENSYTQNQFPDFVWVPNAQIKLTKQTNKDLLYKALTSGEANVETTYYFYSVINGEYTRCEVLRKSDSSRKLLGALVRVQDGTKEYVPNVMLEAGKAVPACFVAINNSSSTEKVRAIHTSSGYVPAALYGSTLYQVKYNSICTSCAFVIGNKLAIPGEDEYENKVFYEALDNGTEYIRNELGTTWTEDEALPLLTKADSSTYEIVEWKDSKDVVSSADKLYKYYDSSVASTQFSYVESGPFYSRARILIWIEGTDREADISLNGGEFTISLSFVGVNKE